MSHSSRQFAVVAAFLIALLASAAPAAARTLTLKPSAARGGTVSFDLRALDLDRVERARLLTGRRSRAVSVRSLRGRMKVRAGRAARLRVTLRESRLAESCGFGSFAPGSWPGACWRPYSADSFLNRPLPANPRLAANSRRMVSRIMDMGRLPKLPLNPDSDSDWFHPLYWSAPSDPSFTIDCVKYGGDCEIDGMQVRIPQQARPADGPDRHLTVIEQATGWEYDLWAVRSPVLPQGGGRLEIGWGGRTRIDGPGGGDADSASDANAAHTGNAGGIIRYPELAAGRIEHALFLTVGCSNGRYVFPARGKAAVCDDIADAPASGQWLRLAMTEAEIEALPVARWQKAIFHAFRTYGGFVADTGGNEAFAFQIESPATYTSFGAPNPFTSWADDEIAAGSPNVEEYHGTYEIDPSAGVDWERRLEVVDPCVIEQTC